MLTASMVAGKKQNVLKSAFTTAFVLKMDISSRHLLAVVSGGVFAPTYADVYLALDGSFVEWRVVPVVPSVWVGPLTQQQRHHLKAKTHERFLSPQEQKKIFTSSTSSSST